MFPQESLGALPTRPESLDESLVASPLHRFKQFVGRRAAALLLGASIGIVGGVASEIADLAPPAATADAGGYPDASAPCVNNNNNQTSGTGYWCIGYNWGYYIRNAQGQITGNTVQSSRGYDYRNCTDWAAWRIKQLTGVTLPSSLGDSHDWDDNAPAAGYAVDNTPEAGDIAVWEKPYVNTFGHVAVVESVNTDGTVNVSEYNKNQDGTYGMRNNVTAHHYIDVNGPNTPALPPLMAGDYTGDGKADPAVFTKGVGSTPAKWAVRLSPGNTADYGQAGDIPVPADYTGTNATDIAVFRPTTNPAGWFVRSDPSLNTAYGHPGDIPVPGNYDNNLNGSKAEFAVYTPSTQVWSIRGMDPQYGVFQFGQPGDIPVPADYNGDGVTDAAIYRPSNGLWAIRNLSSLNTNWGWPDDIPVPGYYNNDRVADIAVYRPSTREWHTRLIGSTVFGEAGDVPVPGDFANDGSTEPTVFRPGSPANWYVQVPGVSYPYGWAGDVPATTTLNAKLLKQFGFISSY